LSDKVNKERAHGLSGFFLITTIFVVAVSILAVYTTILATEYGIKKDDLQVTSLMHLVKSIDWLNDYNEEKIGERILRTQLETLNITIRVNINSSTINSQLLDNFNNYTSHLKLLDSDEMTNGSLLNLKYSSRTENERFLKSLVDISNVSKLIGVYELSTVLLVIGAGLGGMAEIAHNRLLGYSAFLIGGIGIVLVIIISFIPSMAIAIGKHTTIH